MGAFCSPMKAVILAGGPGRGSPRRPRCGPSRWSRSAASPMLWHILKSYSRHGINDFVICLGYAGYIIKEYFANYFLHMSDVTFDLAEEHAWRSTTGTAEPWRVTLVDTGEETQTGGRLKRVRELSRRRDVLLHLRRRRVATWTSARSIAFHRDTGRPRDADGRAARRAASARSTSTGGGSRASRRSRRATAAGSTAASSCSSRRCSTTSRATTRSWERGPLERLAATAS